VQKSRKGVVWCGTFSWHGRWLCHLCAGHACGAPAELRPQLLAAPPPLSPALSPSVGFRFAIYNMKKMKMKMKSESESESENESENENYAQ
jgi:hypothetical protein